MRFVLNRTCETEPLPHGQPCAISTPDGSNECTHPSVIDSYHVLGRPWCGHRYWMAFTPYPGNDPRRFRLENPSIVASDDLEHWAVPKGVRNPLVGSPGAIDFARSVALDVPTRLFLLQVRGILTGRSYNADPALYLSRRGVMYLAHVRSLKGGSHDELIVIESSDGWRSIDRRRVVARTYREDRSHEINVPSIVEAERAGVHLFYGYVPLGGDGRPRFDRAGIRRRSGLDFDSLGPATNLRIHLPPGRRLWHHEVRRVSGGKLICLGTCTPDVGPTCEMTWPPSLSLYWGEIDDDTVEFDRRPLLEAARDGWDSQCIYKPSFLVERDGSGATLHLWYSAQDARTRAWRIGYTRGKAPWEE